MLSRRLVRAFLVLVLVTAGAFALAGCGEDDETSSSALDEALGYLSEDAGFVFIASTDTGDYSEFEDIAEKFPFAGQLEDSLKESLEEGEVDYDADIKPLLGNEVVLGTDDNASFLDDSSDTPFVLALETEDAGKLEDLALSDGSEKTGESEGYDLYQDDDTFLATKDEVVVLSNSEDTLANALEQRGEDDRLTEEDVEPAFEDLPEDAPVKAYVNVKALLAASPDAKDALKVEWVDHIETFGLTAAAEGDDSIALDWSLATDPEGLTDEDLPIASGSEAPQLLERDEGSAEIVFSLRDPAQVIDFTLATLKVVDPAGFAEYESGKKEIGRQLGIDFDKDFLEQLSGDVAAAVTIDGDFGVRAALADAGAFEGTLAKIMDKLPQFSEGTTVTKPQQGDRFYGVATGGDSYAVGVAEDALVIANTAELASQVATRPLVDADGQEGAFVMAADAEQLTNALLGSLVGGLEGLGGTLVTGPLGDLLQSVSASTEGMTGRLELTID